MEVVVQRSLPTDAGKLTLITGTVIKCGDFAVKQSNAFGSSNKVLRRLCTCQWFICSSLFQEKYCYWLHQLIVSISALTRVCVVKKKKVWMFYSLKNIIYIQVCGRALSEYSTLTAPAAHFKRRICWVLHWRTADWSWYQFKALPVNCPTFHSNSRASWIFPPPEFVREPVIQCDMQSSCLAPRNLNNKDDDMTAVGGEHSREVKLHQPPPPKIHQTKQWWPLHGKEHAFSVVYVSQEISKLLIRNCRFVKVNLLMSIFNQ